MLSTKGEAGAVAGIFAFQRWDEFFSKWTPDTYRPRISNLGTLVTEVLELSELARGEPAWGKHLTLVQAELCKALEPAHVRWICTAREMHRLTELVETEPHERTHLLARAMALEDFPASFEERVIERAMADLPRLLPQRKADADLLFRELGTIALRRGLGKSDFDFPPDAVPPLEQFLGSVRDILNRPRQRFFATVEIFGDTADIVAIGRKIGLEMCPADSVGETSHMDDGQLRAFFGKEVEASTGEEALRSLLRELRGALDIHTLYCNSESIRVEAAGWVRAVQAVESRRIGLPIDRGNSLHPRKHARSFTLSSLDILNAGRMDPAVTNALELHAQAFRTGDRRIRLLNTWSALECLAAAAPGKSIISRIVALAVPIVTWRRVEKIARYLAISTHHWRVQGNLAGAVVEGLPHASAGGISVEDMLPALCAPDRSRPILSVLEHVGPNPLLRYRIYRAWETLHDPRALGRELDYAAERLKWQLWRIYRARNMLVHSGVEVPMLDFLTDNLHYYFSTVLSRLIHGLALNPEWSLADSAFHWSIEFGFVRKQLQNSPEVITMANLVPTPRRDASRVLWPAPAAVAAA